MDETGIVEEDVIGKEGLQETMGPIHKLRVAWGCPFFIIKRPVDQTQKGTPYGVRVHVQNGHSGGRR